MRLLLLFVLVGLAASWGRKPLPVQEAPKPKLEPVRLQEDGLDIGGRIQQFLDFLCTRCQDVVIQINRQIDGESLVEYAEQFCDRVIAINSLRDVCHNLTRSVLKEVYAFLKRLEPNPQMCARLRLCDSCGFNASNYRALRLEPEDDPAKQLSDHFEVLARLAPFGKILAPNAAEQNDNQIKL